MIFNEIDRKINGQKVRDAAGLDGLLKVNRPVPVQFERHSGRSLEDSAV